MLIKKTLKFDDADLKFKGESGTFEGYASKWGGVDSYGDTIVKGAFAKTLAKTQPKMFWNHQWDMPVGKWLDIGEDDTGLFVKGELTPGLTLATDIRAAMKHGTLDGLSIGGFLRKDGYEEKDGRRTIHEWSDLAEISPVAFPADGAARIDLNSVKSIDFESLLPTCKSEKEIERLLRDAGLGKWEAMAIVSRVRAIVKGSDSQQEVQADQTAQVLERIQRMCA